MKERQPQKEKIKIYSASCDYHGFIGYSTSMNLMGFIILDHIDQYGCSPKDILVDCNLPDIIYSTDDA